MPSVIIYSFCLLGSIRSLHIVRMQMMVDASTWKSCKLETTSGTRATQPCRLLVCAPITHFSLKLRWHLSHVWTRLEWIWKDWRVSWAMVQPAIWAIQVQCVTKARFATQSTTARLSSMSRSLCPDCRMTSFCVETVLRINLSIHLVATSTFEMKQIMMITYWRHFSETMTAKSIILALKL